MRRFSDIIPDFIKPVLRPLWLTIKYSQRLRKIRYHPYYCKPINVHHQYWREPTDSGNLPASYLTGEPRSKFLVELVRRYATAESSILEIGCYVGRNLNYLFLAGFKNLTGIEISEKAVKLLKQSFPEMARYAKIHNLPVEEIIREFRDREFDIVFTMAVLQHIHTDSEWIFPKIARITRDYLITVENECVISWRHFPRNYKKVFEPLGLKQIEELNCDGIDELGISYFCRIFKKLS